MTFYKRKLTLIVFSFIVGFFTYSENKRSTEVQKINFDDPMVISPGVHSLNFENYNINVNVSCLSCN